MYRQKEQCGAFRSNQLNVRLVWEVSGVLRYMSDVSMTAEGLDAAAIDDFKSSRWFRRGWTLQELLAPSEIIFYDKNWRCLGNRAKLANHITSATGIDKRYLRSRIQCANASIATRMSWASHRSTTRLEDEAYCLLGLFQVRFFTHTT